MKVFSVIILSVIVFIASFQSSLIYIDYELNKDFYEMHCVNKNLPELECHGKCKVKKDAENSTSATDTVNVNFNFNLHKSSSTVFSLPKLAVKEIAAKIVIENNLSLFTGHVSIFPNPPQV